MYCRWILDRGNHDLLYACGTAVVVANTSLDGTQTLNEEVAMQTSLQES